MDIPLLDLKAQYRSLRREVEQKIYEIMESQMFILGDEVEALEKELAEYSGVRFGVGVSSGSDALIISLMTLGVGPGDLVVTAPFTFFATAGAISRVGALPLFCDIDPVTYNLCPDRLEELLETEFVQNNLDKIKAVIPIHLYGQCADMTRIVRIARKYDLFVIEDACQAVGAEYPGENGIRKACGFGTMGTLSFFPSKNLGGFGDGGMVLTGDEELAAKLKLLRVHGGHDRYYHDILGGNFRLDAIQAAVLRIKLRHLDRWQRAKRENAACYDRLFEESGLTARGRVKTPEPIYRSVGVENYHIYHQYVIEADERDRLQRYLGEQGVASAIYYPLPLHLQKCFAHLGYGKGDFPVSENACRKVLALPIYAELTPEQQNTIVSAVSRFYSDKP